MKSPASFLRNGLASRIKRSRRKGDTAAKRLTLENLERRELLAVVTVSNLLDSANGNTSSIAALTAPGGDGGDGISLREAIVAANMTNGADTVEFDVMGTIVLGSQLPQVTGDLAINGPGSDQLTIDGDDNGILRTSYGTSLDLEKLTLTGGRDFLGGAINAAGPLSIADSVFSGNSATARGGAVYSRLSNLDTISISNSQFVSNEAAGQGGGLAVWLNSFSALPSTSSDIAQIDINGSLFDQNSAGDLGGGLFINSNSGTFALQDEPHVALVDSVITSNKADDGGGAWLGLGHSNYGYNYGYGYIGGFHEIAVNGKIDVAGSIFGGNEASNRGGGIYHYGAGGSETTVRESVITGNKAGVDLDSVHGEIEHSGGGIYSYMVSGPQGETSDPNNDPSLVASLSLFRATIDNNLAGEAGGGVAVCSKRGGALSSEFNVGNSTISSNRAGYTTVDNPEEGRGGGVFLAIYHVGTEDEGLRTEFRNATVTGNTAGTGGGIFSYYNIADDSNMDTRLRNTIISGNVDHDSVANNFVGAINNPLTDFSLYGPGNSFRRNVFPHDVISLTGPNNIDNTDNNPRLAPLDDNGGIRIADGRVVQTHAPIVEHEIFGGITSPAIDNGSNSLVPDVVDQRGTGFTRFAQGDFDTNGAPHTDIGAFEVQGDGLVVVSSMSDEFDMDFSHGNLSLREAVYLTNVAEIYQITFAPELYLNQTAVIELSYDQDGNGSPDPLVLGEDVVLTGPRANRLKIVGNGASNIFQVLAGVQASITGLSLTGGVTAINNRGNLTLDGLEIHDNSATGISSYRSTLSVYNSTVAGNGGYGIYVGQTGATISNVTATGNRIGVVVVMGNATITNSTITQNHNTAGGAGVVAGYGGGVTLYNSIVVDNFSGTSGATIDLHAAYGSFHPQSSNNLIGESGNTALPDGTTTAQIDLAVLGYYGGPTRTHALLRDSVAIDYGAEISAVPLDQRGFRRDQHALHILNDGTDAGAFEFQGDQPFIVNTWRDHDVETGGLSLRQAINLAEQDFLQNEVVTLGTLACQTIALTADEDWDGSKDHITIDADVTIVGLGADLLTVDGEFGVQHVFEVTQFNTVEISGLKITRGAADGSGGQGGGILSRGNLLLDGVEVANNRAGVGAGIHHTHGWLQIHNSTIAENIGAYGVGGLLAAQSPIVWATNTTISGNTASYGVGGAAITSVDSGLLVNLTIADNSIGSPYGKGGGLYVLDNGAGEFDVTMHNSIVARNFAGCLPEQCDPGMNIASDIYGVLNSASSFNLVGTGGSGNLQTSQNNQVDQSLADIDLMPLDDYGGPTRTHALGYDSLAIDSADSSLAPALDQRGAERDFIPDRGAYEAFATLPLVAASDEYAHPSSRFTIPSLPSNIEVDETENEAIDEFFALLWNL